MQDPIDNQPSGMSLNPQPVVTEVIAAAVSYDQQVGEVTAAVTFNRSLSEAGALEAAVTLIGPRGCTDSSVKDPVPTLRIWLDTTPYQNANGEYKPQASAELQGYFGMAVVDSQISADGRTVSATVNRPSFASRDWRCVRGNSNEAEPDGFAFPFAGYEPKELTPATALTTLKSELTRRYGPGWDKAGSWTACPEVEILPDGYTENPDGPQGLCEFRFRQGNLWRHGSVILTEQFGDIVTTSLSSWTFAKAMRSCPPLRTLRAQRVFDRRLRAGGWVGCGDNSASLIRDLHLLKPGVRRVSFHGTNRAGFQDAVSFRCVLRARTGGRRSATCANTLGDRFVYTFRLSARKAAPR